MKAIRNLECRQTLGVGTLIFLPPSAYFPTVPKIIPLGAARTKVIMAERTMAAADETAWSEREDLYTASAATDDEGAA